MAQTTVAKLKALLEAIDLMLEEDEWTPTARQWKRIRQMIDDLPEEDAVPAPTPTRTMQYESSARPARSGPTHPQHLDPGGNPFESGNVNFPEVPSAIPPDAPRTPTSGGSALSGAAAPRPAPTAPTGGNHDINSPPPSPRD